MYAWMDGYDWMDGYELMYGWIDGWMDGWIDERKGGYEWMDMNGSI